MVSGITCGTTTVASGTLANGMLGFIDTSSGLLFKLSITDLAQLFHLVNLPEEVQTASGEIQQAYVLNKISTYGNYMLQIGLADMVYPQIQKLPQSASYLVILWPVFDELAILPILGNILKSAIVGTLLFFIYKFIFINSDLWIALWDKFTHVILN